jgi:hypothetical protein
MILPPAGEKWLKSNSLWEINKITAIEDCQINKGLLLNSVDCPSCTIELMSSMCYKALTAKLNFIFAAREVHGEKTPVDQSAG